MSKGEVTIKPATLRAFRKIRGLSQSALSIKATEWLRAEYPDEPDIGVGESMIALIETGRRQPSKRNAEGLAAALGIDLDALADLAVAA